MSGSQTIEVLCAAKRLTKLWQADGTIKPYDSAKNFRREPREVSGIDGLSALLKELESQANKCIVRGRFVGAAAAAEVAKSLPAGDKPKAEHVFRRQEFFTDAPSHVLMVEIDSYETITNAVTDPESAIDEYLRKELPEFQAAQYCWQLSASAGHPEKPGLRAHVWFWLSEPRTCAELQAWAIGRKLDASVFQPVQIHYTAAPIFQAGVPDPVKLRSGRGGDFLGDESVSLNLPKGSSALVSVLQGGKPGGENDAVVSKLYDRGMVKGKRADGGLNVACPNAGEHTSESGDTSTIYYPSHTGGYERGAFVCMHAHCRGRPQSEFSKALGIHAHGQDVARLEDFASFRNVVADDKSARRFTPIPVRQFMSGTPPRWIIKGVLPAADLIVIYGASTSGKSFFAVDMAMHIARGMTWRGRTTKARRVVYVCAEAADGFKVRTKAYAVGNSVPDAEDLDRFRVIGSAPNLLEGETAKEFCADIQAAGGADVVIVDTLAATAPGADENTSRDMGQYMYHCKGIREATGATVILIHHSGKDATKGARGWSGLRAGVDAEIEISRDDNSEVRRALIAKQKDGQDGVEFGFTLRTVVLGVDEDGDDVTSCVVVPCDVAKRSTSKAPRLRDRQKEVLSVSNELFESTGFLDRESVIRRVAEISPAARAHERAGEIFDNLKAKGVLPGVLPSGAGA